MLRVQMILCTYLTETKCAVLKCILDVVVFPFKLTKFETQLLKLKYKVYILQNPQADLVGVLLPLVA